MISPKAGAIDKIGIQTMLDELSEKDVQIAGEIIYRFKKAQLVRTIFTDQDGRVTTKLFKREFSSP